MNKLLCIVACCGLAMTAQASELMTSARQLGIGRVSAVAYYTHNQQDISFDRRGDLDLVTDALIGKVTVKVWDAWHVYLKAGSIGADLEDDAILYEKDTDFQGTVYGGGVRRVIFPDTIVTPAVSFEAGATAYTADLKQQKSGGNSAAIDNEVAVIELQAVLEMSKKLAVLEPYGGVKVIRTDVTWKDNNPSAADRTIEGDGTGVAPFAGIRFSFIPFVDLTLEGSLGQEQAASVGITIGF